MAYAANGNDFPSKKLSRVKYNLLPGDNYSMPKAPELIKIGIVVSPEIFFDSTDDYNPLPFDPSMIEYNYGGQIFTDVANLRNMVWVNQEVTGTCLDKVLDFIDFAIWILATNIWVDSGVWLDYEFWND